MSSLLNPLHPGTIFLATRKGRQFFTMGMVIMPPGSQLVLITVPTEDLVWIIALDASSPARDVATGNPIVSPFFYMDIEHSQITHTRLYAFESYYNYPWACDLHVSTGDPLVHTITNNTALTVSIDFNMAIMEIPKRAYEEYMRLWHGLENLLNFMGGFNSKQVDTLVKHIKELVPKMMEEEAEK